VVTIDDRGDRILLELSGRTWTGAEIVSHSFTIAAEKTTTISATTTTTTTITDMTTPS
jgi:hypothetical protein